MAPSRLMLAELDGHNSCAENEGGGPVAQISIPVGGSRRDDGAIWRGRRR